MIKYQSSGCIRSSMSEVFRSMKNNVMRAALELCSKHLVCGGLIQKLASYSVMQVAQIASRKATASFPVSRQSNVSLSKMRIDRDIRNGKIVQALSDRLITKLMKPIRSGSGMPAIKAAVCFC